jgi:hypothetical protein
MNRRQGLGAMVSFAMAGIDDSIAAAPHDAAFDALLGLYVVAHPDGVNRVDYARWKGTPEHVARLESYVRDLSGRVPSRMPRDEAFAFWCNLYNAITLKVVLDRYPVASIRDIKSDGLLDPKAYFGPWRTKRVSVEGRSYSLDDIEHGVLRPGFGDSRVHYALNCAALGCPNMRNRAWTATNLASSLDRAAHDFVNHPRGVTLLPGNRLRVSSIYTWFRDDFGGTDTAVIAHLRKYAARDLATTLVGNRGIAEHHYDWSLNDAHRG